MAEETTKKALLLLDCPGLGNKDHVQNGLLTIIVGGDPAINR